MYKIVILLTFLFFPAISMAGQLGPVPAASPGQFSLGMGIAHQVEDWEFDTIGFTSEARQTQIYVQGAVGLPLRSEIYLRFGAADLTIDKVLALSDFDDDFVPFAEFGVQNLFYQGKYFNLGILFQGGYFSEYENSDDGNTIKIDDSYSLLGGVSFSKELEGALLYGGPLFSYKSGDFTYNLPDILSGSSTGAGTFESDSNFGAFLGVRWLALGDIVIDIESQFLGSVSINGGISFLF